MLGRCPCAREAGGHPNSEPGSQEPCAVPSRVPKSCLLPQSPCSLLLDGGLPGHLEGGDWAPKSGFSGVWQIPKPNARCNHSYLHIPGYWSDRFFFKLEFIQGGVGVGEGSSIVIYQRITEWNNGLPKMCLKSEGINYTHSKQEKLPTIGHLLGTKNSLLQPTQGFDGWWLPTHYTEVKTEA